MNKQKGFIQIPILIAIVIGVIVVGGSGYIVVRQYQSQQADNPQQKALEQIQMEIKKLKQESEAAKQKQGVTERRSASYTISARDLEPYLTSVVYIICPINQTALTNPTDLNTVSGSGILWETEYVLTNRHVVDDAISSCVATAINKDGIVEGQIAISLRNEASILFSEDSGLDIAVLRGSDYNFEKIRDSWIKSIDKLNYSISRLRKCPSRMAVGSPATLIGFPVSGVVKLEEGSTTSLRIITNGIISGLDISGIVLEKLSYPNYFVSAKIDSGNSGGIALSKDENGLCVLGIPTWLTVGDYETQGIVQNMHNIFGLNQ